MKKIFLTSITENVLSKLSGYANLNPEKTKVAFIPTASDPYDDKGFVESDKKEWIKQGYNLEEVDIKDRTKEELQKLFDNKDIIYLSGGNVFYLLQEANKCNLKEVLQSHLDQNKIIAGGSAGAVIFCPSIESLQGIDEPKKAPELSSFKAFNFVDFVVLPHFDYEKYNIKYQEVLKNKKIKFQPLNNDQAIFVRNNNIEII